MNIGCSFVVFALCIATVKNSIDFIDCGLTLETIEVKLGDCVVAPCEVQNNEKQNVVITIGRGAIVNDVPPLTNIVASAEVMQMGMYWQIPISPEDVCKSWSCPLQDKNKYIFKGQVEVSGVYLQRPGKLKIQASVGDSKFDPLFCAKIDILIVQQ